MVVETPAKARSRGNACVHRWLISPPDGKASTGVCKRCGARRRFSNSPPGFISERPEAARAVVVPRAASEHREFALADEV
jgi:hypothetical protein